MHPIFSLESPQSSWISFYSLLRHSLITEGITFIFNEQQTAELQFLLEPFSHQPVHHLSHHSLPVMLYLFLKVSLSKKIQLYTFMVESEEGLGMSQRKLCKETKDKRLTKLTH